VAEKAIFFDRDNTLIEDPGYVNHPDQVKLLPGAAQSLVQLKQLGYKLVVVSNQSGVARGILTEKVLQDIHHRLKQLLALEGAYLDAIYYCPYHPEGAVEKYRRDSELRKPNPGMLLLAAERIGIDLAQSWMIGNSYDDIAAGRCAGCRTILVNPPPYTTVPRPDQPAADYQAVNIKEAANIVKRYDQTERSPASTTQPAEQLAEIESTADRAPPESTTVDSRDEAACKQMAESPVGTEQSEPAESQQLLQEILTTVRKLRREEMYEEFSALKLFAGLLQMVVLLCLVLGVWFLLDTSKQSSSVLVVLGFSAVFQLMALTLYIMHGRR
jgi:D,D-heptose 1,7-bisphosphate phosphatase